MQVSTLLHRQGGCCFYCRKPLEERNAVMDHVIPRAIGDYEGFTNIVACCALINSLFQDLPPKHKIEILLNWWGRSPCPHDIGLSQEEILRHRKHIVSSCFNDPIYKRSVFEINISDPLIVPDVFINNENDVDES